MAVKKVAKKVVAKKKAPVKKVVAKKKPAPKKVVAKKKPTPKKVVAKKVVAKKKPTPKKVVAKKKPTPKKVVAKKKPTPKKVVAKKKPTPKKVVAKKVVAKKKTPVKKVVAKKKPAPKMVVVKKVASKKPVPAKIVPLKVKSSSQKGLKQFRSYEAKKGEGYMSKSQLNHFRSILNEWKTELSHDMDRTVHTMQDELTSHADPNDRASQESDMALELRNRDRERKLIKKIDETLRNIESQDYGYCAGCGEEIGLKRLEARPTATLCIDCKTLDEIREKQMAG
jgi:DnaK suppressor protein